MNKNARIVKRIIDKNERASLDTYLKASPCKKTVVEPQYRVNRDYTDYQIPPSPIRFKNVKLKCKFTLI